MELKSHRSGHAHYFCRETKTIQILKIVIKNDVLNTYKILGKENSKKKKFQMGGAGVVYVSNEIPEPIGRALLSVTVPAGSGRRHAPGPTAA